MVDRNPVFPLVQNYLIAPTRSMLLYPPLGELGFNLRHGKQAHCRSISPPRISTIKGCTKCEIGSRRTYLEILCSKRRIKKTLKFGFYLSLCVRTHFRNDIHRNMGSEVNGPSSATLTSATWPWAATLPRCPPTISFSPRRCPCTDCILQNPSV